MQDQLGQLQMNAPEIRQIYYISDPKLKEKIKILRERCRLFHLEIRYNIWGFYSYRIVQGRHKNMRGKISVQLYGDCTFVGGDMTFKYGDCTGLSGDFTGLPPGDVRDLMPRIFVQIMDKPSEGEQT